MTLYHNSIHLILSCISSILYHFDSHSISLSLISKINLSIPLYFLSYLSMSEPSSMSSHPTLIKMLNSKNIGSKIHPMSAHFFFHILNSKSHCLSIKFILYPCWISSFSKHLQTYFSRFDCLKLPWLKICFKNNYIFFF